MVQVLDRTPEPALEPVMAREPAPAAFAVDDGRAAQPVGSRTAENSGVEVVRWRRDGHDRLYVNDTTSERRLAWRDQRTGEVHVEDGADAVVVHAALAAWDRTDQDG
jgi:hypothetical protein